VRAPAYGFGLVGSKLPASPPSTSARERSRPRGRHFQSRFMRFQRVAAPFRNRNNSQPPPCLEGLARGVHFRPRLNLYNTLGAFFCNAVRPSRVSDCGSYNSQYKEVIYFQSSSCPDGETVFPPEGCLRRRWASTVLVFSSCKAGEGLAPFIALGLCFCAPLSADVSFGPEPRNGRIPRRSSSVLGFVKPRVWEPDTALRRPREENIRFFRPNAFRAYSTEEAPVLHFPRRLQRLSVSS
jgi:hypothetical protein